MGEGSEILETAEGEGASAALGERLRLRRLVRRLSLKEVAAASGVSIGQLSQIERGLSQPSLRSLRAICAALEMPMVWLFEGGGAGEDDIVVRRHQRRRFELGASGMAKELLSQDHCAGLQMMQITLTPDVSDSQIFDVRGQARCGLVLAGTLGLEVDGRASVLGKGDAFSFENRKTLRFWCEGERDCVIVWVAAPAIY